LTEGGRARSVLFALDPRKALSQDARTTRTRLKGLPQDTIRPIAQTKDGYLWLATNYERRWLAARERGMQTESERLTVSRAIPMDTS
jgi:hypothetical protein